MVRNGWVRSIFGRSKLVFSLGLWLAGLVGRVRGVCGVHWAGALGFGAGLKHFGVAFGAIDGRDLVGIAAISTFGMLGGSAKFSTGSLRMAWARFIIPPKSQGHGRARHSAAHRHFGIESHPDPTRDLWGKADKPTHRRNSAWCRSFLPRGGETRRPCVCCVPVPLSIAPFVPACMSSTDRIISTLTAAVSSLNTACSRP